MTQVCSFDEKLKESEGVSVSANAKEIIIGNIAGAVGVHKSHESNDRSGTDWWVECESGRHLSVDTKVRSFDFQLRGQDDLALETWSVVEASKIGWTLDTTKRSDFILWLWTDTGRWCILPFPMLCKVFTQHREDWVSRFKVARQKTKEYGGYHSECVFVPRRDIWAAMYTHYSGNGVKQ